MNLEQWAIKWGVPYAALADMRLQMGQFGTFDPKQKDGESEAGVQSRVRLEASTKGYRLWRNQVGAFQDDTGRWVRFGLANDSKQINTVIKSGDLIGIDARPIEAWEVGKPRGRFVSREIKEQGWRYSGEGREAAQLNWVNLVNSLGGDAAFASSVGTL